MQDNRLKLFLAVAVLVLKSVLAGAAFYLVAIRSMDLFWVFALFILIDILDGRLLGEGFRLWDTIGDRIFAYACFLALMVFSETIYPIFILIMVFLAKDMTITLLAWWKKTGTVRSSLFDRLAILMVALYFVSFAVGLKGEWMEGFFGLAIGIVILQFALKVRKILGIGRRIVAKKAGKTL